MAAINYHVKKYDKSSSIHYTEGGENVQTGKKWINVINNESENKIFLNGSFFLKTRKNY